MEENSTNTISESLKDFGDGYYSDARISGEIRAMFEPKINPRDFESEMTLWKHKPTCVKAMQLGKSCKIETLEGTMKGKVLDYLVKGTRGEFYIVDKDIFENIYEVLLKGDKTEP